MQTAATKSTGEPTPGPWSFSPWMQDAADIAELKTHGLEPTRRLTNEGQAIVMSEKGRVALVDCQTDFKRGKGYQTDCAERDANARVIAASWEMLAALQAIIRAYDSDLSWTDQIAREVASVRAAIAKATGAPND